MQKRFLNLKTEEKLPSSSLGKNFPFGWCFVENSWTDWQLAVSSQLAVHNGSKMRKTREKGKAKAKKQKSLKKLVKTFWHACTKKCHKTGCYCKERRAFMFNFEWFGLITDQKCPKMRIFQESPRVNGGNRFIFQSSCSSVFSRAIDNGLKTIQTDKNLDRYIDGLLADSTWGSLDHIFKCYFKLYKKELFYYINYHMLRLE